MKLFLVDYKLTAADRALTDHLREAGHSVVTAAAEGPAHYGIGSAADRRLHRTLARLTDTALLHSARATALMLEKVAAERPDAVHIRSLGGFYLNLPLLADALTRFRVPAVVEFSDADLSPLPGALLSRAAYRRRTLGKILGHWEQLHAVTSSRATASDELLAGHPGYIIPDKSDAEAYAAIYSGLV